MYDQQDYENQTFMGDKEGFEGYNPRLGFIKKVYGIISIQLIITTIFVVIAQSTNLLNTYGGRGGATKAAMAFFGVCCVATFIISIVLTCYTSVARRVPVNYILLSVFTICESYIVALITTFYDGTTVMLAAGLTAFLTVTLTVYACTTKKDFTMYGGILCILSWGLFAISILCCYVFFSKSQNLKYVTIILSVLAVCLYGVYLIYDTQLIVGQGRYKLTLDDYIVGALIIYIDIIMLFIHLLRIIGNSR